MGKERVFGRGGEKVRGERERKGEKRKREGRGRLASSDWLHVYF